MIKEEILKLKEEKDAVILAHSYQNHDIVEIADYVGDSFALSVDASKVENKVIIMCGVRFMAETAKILCPDKTVILAEPSAGCPMAEQMTKDYILSVKEKYPDYKVVSYINTTAELKTISDVCVTSSSALKVVGALDSDKIIFIPDKNLGGFVKKAYPDKDIVLLDGGCPIHSSITVKEVQKIKAEHPEALLLVHPECTADVVALADYVGSTAGIMAYAKNSEKREFIIGTENNIAVHLSYDCPDKKFYTVCERFVCPDMRTTTLETLKAALDGTGGEEIILSDETIKKARACIDEMLRLG